MHGWTALPDEELRAELDARFADETFVSWLVAQRRIGTVERLIDATLDD